MCTRRLATSPRPELGLATLDAVPLSDPENKQWALDHIRQLAPAVIVDIGPGAGTYSDLARAATSGTWKAIEAWAPYVTKYGLWQKYDHVVIADVRHVDLHSVAFAPDLVIIGDVLEHLDPAEARTVLKRLQAWADHVLVALPVIHYEQDAVGGNWFEIHRYHWGFDEMTAAIGPGLIDSIEGETLGYYWWSQSA